MALVQEHGVGLGGVDDRLLPVVVDRRLERRDHPRAHLDALGAERERGRHRAPSVMPPAAMIGTSTASTDERQAAPSSTPGRALEAATFAAFDHQAVNARIDRLHRRARRRHDVIHGQARAP